MSAAVPASQITAAYAHCRSIARRHYENFPVASILIPRRLRGSVAAVYAFARAADDIADEGSDTPVQRRRSLDAMRSGLDACVDGEADHLVFIALGDTIRRFSIPRVLFHALLDAFTRDLTTPSYESFEELRAYCRLSADPVGRIMLSLFGSLTNETAPASDSLCTGLQLANFWQDVSVDVRKGRIYIPAEDLRRFGVRASDIAEARDDQNLRALIRFETERTRTFFTTAADMLPHVPRRLRMNLKAVIRGGQAILDAVDRQQRPVTQARPRLSKSDYLRILLSAFTPS